MDCVIWGVGRGGRGKVLLGGGDRGKACKGIDLSLRSVDEGYTVVGVSMGVNIPLLGNTHLSVPLVWDYVGC